MAVFQQNFIYKHKYQATLPCGYPLPIPSILQEFIHKPLNITFFTKYYHSFLRRLKIKNTLMDRKEEGN